MNQIFASSVGNYLVPTLHSVCKSTHRTAIIADMAASHSNNSGRGVKTATAVVQDHTKLHNAVTLLQESFSRTYNDRKELRAVQFDTNHRDRPILDDRDSSSKKAGVLGIVNELFSIYFRLNTLRLCKNLVKPVEVRKLHIGTTGGVTIGQLVTYKYYTGRLFLFEDQYIDAENNLQYAYDNCHRNAYANKRRILCYLIPVKLYRGKLPSIECTFL